MKKLIFSALALVRSRRWRMNSSGCCDSISNGLSASAGKSSKLHVTIKLAPLRIAAANTCRSSSSGNTSPEMRCSYPLTSASGAALSINCRVRSSFSLVRSGLFFRRFRIHSSCTSADHFARKTPVSARCIRKFRNVAGYRTFAS